MHSTEEVAYGHGTDLHHHVIITSVIVFLLVVALVFWVRTTGRQNRITPLAGLAFAFVVAGIIFGDNRLIGYGLMGVGVVLAVVDTLIHPQRR